MLRILILFVVLVYFAYCLVSYRVLAASSDLISFQAKLVNSDGTNVADGTYDFKFSIYDAASGGTLLWEESHSVSVTAGVVSLDLGSSTSLPTDLFNNDDLYLQIEMDTDGNTSNGYEEDFGRMPLTAVPYAFHAKVADALSLGGISYSPDDFLKKRENDQWNPDQNLSFLRFLGNSDNSLFYIDASSDRVGVGTDSPDAKLHVEGGEIWEFSDSTDPRFVIGDTPNSGDYGWLQWDSANNYFRIDTSASPSTGFKVADNTIAIGNVWPDPNALFIAANGSTEHFRITDGGTVGINTTSPESMFDIIGSYNNQGIRVKVGEVDDAGLVLETPDTTGAGTQDGARIALLARANDGSSEYKRWFFINAVTTSNSGAGRLDFATGLDTYTKNGILSMLSNGFVGIGTNTPGDALEVVGRTRAEGFLATSIGTASKPAFSFLSDTNTGMFDLGPDRLALTTDGATRLYIDNFGRVGVSTTAPLATLHVAGTFRVNMSSLFLDDVTIQNSSNYPLEVDYGDGSDGDFTVTSANTVVNKYSALSSNASAGDTSIVVDTPGNFGANDTVLIIQMQSASNPDNVGNYEFKRVVSVSGSTLTLSAPLENSYTTGTFNSTNAEAAQVIRVPEFNDLTISDGASITADAWDGKTGGIVAIKVRGVLRFNGTGKIDVTAKGYRGGSCNGCGNNAWGQQGEGITGLGQNSLDANVNGGGGGYGPSGYGGEPGAGGGCRTAGKDGVSSYTSKGGEAVCTADKLIMGGGAGAGGDDDNKTPLPQYVDGGGAVLVSAAKIDNATIIADGENGIATTNNAGGTTGGGAGGTIKVYYGAMTENIISANGGAGGVDNDDTGGDGGDGLIVKVPQYETNKLFFADVSEGHIGIRMPTPEYPLDVGGIVRASAFLEYSDERLKKNIHELKEDDILSKIQKLRPVIYQYKDGKLGEHNRLGFLAQEVKDVFPELVFQDKAGTYSIDYVGLVAPLVSSIKQLNKKIENVAQGGVGWQKDLNNGVLNTKKLVATHVETKTVRTEHLEVSDNILLHSKVAGKFVIKAGNNKYTLISESITPSSIIIINQEADSFEDLVRFIIKKEKGKATITIEKSAQKDLVFDYLIVNTDSNLDSASGPTCTPPVPVKPPITIEPPPAAGS